MTAAYSGWDDLFNKCSENLNSLTAMRLSPYYKGITIDKASCHVFLYYSSQFLRKTLLHGRRNSIEYTSCLVCAASLQFKRLLTLSIDVWIDVQRQWVYLEGIFTGSA